MSRGIGLRIPEGQNVIATGLYPVSMPLSELEATRELLINQRSFLDQRIERFNAAIKHAHGTPALNPTLPAAIPTGRRKMSAAARKKLAAAARARWAKTHAAEATGGTTEGAATGTPAAQATGRKKRGRKPRTMAAGA